MSAKATSKSSLGQTKMTNAPRGKRYSLPSGLYFAMVDISRKYEISTREVEITLIRTMLKKHGFVCNYDTDKISVSHTKNGAYCSWCWTRMEKVVTNRGSSFASQKTTFVPKKDL